MTICQCKKGIVSGINTSLKKQNVRKILQFEHEQLTFNPGWNLRPFCRIKISRSWTKYPNGTMKPINFRFAFRVPWDWAGDLPPLVLIITCGSGKQTKMKYVTNSNVLDACTHLFSGYWRWFLVMKSFVKLKISWSRLIFRKYNHCWAKISRKGQFNPCKQY